MWKIQPVNMGTGVWFSLSKCWPRFTTDPGAASIPAELLSASITYCQVSGPVTKEAFTSRQRWWGGDHSHRPSKLWCTRHWTLRMAQVQDSPLPISLLTSFHILSGLLESNNNGNTCINQAVDQHEWNMPALGRQLLTQESVNCCGWRCQL